MSAGKAWIGYTVYALVFTAVVLWLRFPSGLLARTLEAKVAEAYPKAELTIEQARLSPALSLVLQGAELTQKGQGTVVSVRELHVRPEIRSLLEGDLACRFSGLAYQGSVEGRVAFTRGSNGGDVQLALKLADVQVGSLEITRHVLGRKAGGRISGTLTYRGMQSDPFKGVAEAHLGLTEGRLAYLNFPPLFRLESVSFEDVTLDLMLESGVLVLERCVWRGPQSNGEFSGGIALETRLGRSRLDLQGSLKPSSEFLRGQLEGSSAAAYIKEQMRKQRKGSISLAVSGTVADPIVKIL